MAFNGSDTDIGLPPNASYTYRFVAPPDERTRTWPLVESPWNVAAVLASYLLMVRFGPKWAARYKPMQLRVPLFLHSLAMALLNAHIFLELFTASRALGYSYSCQPCRVSYSPHEMRITTAMWWFYISKVFEFADTAFFILRHKWSQLSFLHVYHHSSMFCITWAVVKWMPSGSAFLPALINCFIHIIMYGYYAASTLGPRVQRFLWWKRYLTGLQLIQFGYGVFWGTQATIRKCDISTWALVSGSLYMLPFIYLFGKFYLQSYGSKPSSKKAK
ncbi:uncharacterized protein Dana_GF10549 [Drosophila ananassae]|uniref:Elongation of very long chain fatty acids protein n=1 Tax=Drosophila ananassae TaxID=7217 RepID=B3M4U3_DROAN|nr:elongation of very long chain fatty acids protein 4 [Drosophila ananassae]EDV40517.1 uncharacterized protein Dana_GF10549 [Drosophila ananassae]